MPASHHESRPRVTSCQTCAASGSCARLPLSSEVRTMSAVTGALRNRSSPSASASAVQHGAEARADRRLAHAARADRRLRIGNVQRVPLIVQRGVEDRRRFVVMEAPGQRHAVLRVVHPFLGERVSDAQHRAAEDLAAEAARMRHRADVGNCRCSRSRGTTPVSTSTSTSAKPTTKEWVLPSRG